MFKEIFLGIGIGLLFCTCSFVQGKSLDPSFQNCNSEPESCTSVCPAPGLLQSFAGGKPSPPSCDPEGACHCDIEIPTNSNQNYCTPTAQEMSGCQCNGGSTIEAPYIYHGKKCDEAGGPKYCVCFRSTRNQENDKKGKAAAKSDAE